MKKSILSCLIMALCLLGQRGLAQTPIHNYESTHPVRNLSGSVSLPGGAQPGYVKEDCYVSYHNFPTAPIDLVEVSAWYFDENGDIVDLGYSTNYMENSPWPAITYEYPADITNLHYYWSVFYTDGTYEIQTIDYWDM